MAQKVEVYFCSFVGLTVGLTIEELYNGTQNDARMQITITTTNFIRIKYPFNHYELSKMHSSLYSF